jgi:multidrug efflux pump subunit AcrA (membrane-fusion protein)
MSGKQTEQYPTPSPMSDDDFSYPASAKDSYADDAQPKGASGWRRFLLPTLIGLGLLGGGGWVVYNRVVLPIMMFSQMKPPPPTQVPLSNPQVATVEDSSDYSATLDSRQSVRLQPQVAGQVAAIYVREGDRVQQSDRILDIDATEQQAQVASRLAGVETARAEVASAQADVEAAIAALRSLQSKREAAVSNVRLNQQEYQRFQELFNEGASSKQVLDQRLNAIQTAQASLAEVDANMREQESAIARARAQVVRNQQALSQQQANVSEGKAQLKYYTINAPFTGIVGDIPAKVGDVVGTSTQLLTLTQNQQLEVQIPIPLERASQLRRGLPVRLLDDQGKTVTTGSISFIAPNVDSGTQSIQVKARFANPSDSLRTAQFVRARVIWSNRPGVLVPTTAISRLGGKNFIFIGTSFQKSGCKALAQGQGDGPPSAPQKADPNQLVASQRLVELGKIIGNNQEVLEGVTASDRIITTGILQLQNCLPIAEASPTPPSS